MHVVPYICTGSPEFRKIWLFLERNGTHLLEMNPNDVEGFLEENGLQSLGKYEEGGVVYSEIDAKTEGLDQFYTWSEVLPGTTPAREVWRQFLWLDESEKLWGVNAQLEQISLSPTHTVYSILKEIVSRSKAL